MAELTNQFGQVLTAPPGTRVVAFIPKGAKVMLHNSNVWFFHKDYPASTCTVGEVTMHQPQTLEQWLKIVRPVVLEP